MTRCFLNFLLRIYSFIPKVSPSYYIFVVVKRHIKAKITDQLWKTRRVCKGIPLYSAGSIRNSISYLDYTRSLWTRKFSFFALSSLSCFFFSLSLFLSLLTQCYFAALWRCTREFHKLLWHVHPPPPPTVSLWCVSDKGLKRATPPPCIPSQHTLPPIEQKKKKKYIYQRNSLLFCVFAILIYFAPRGKLGKNIKQIGDKSGSI